MEYAESLVQESSEAFTRCEHGHKDKQERERARERAYEKHANKAGRKRTQQGGCMLGLCGKGGSIKVAGGKLSQGTYAPLRLY